MIDSLHKSLLVLMESHQESPVEAVQHGVLEEVVSMMNRSARLGENEEEKDHLIEAQTIEIFQEIAKKEHQTNENDNKPNEVKKVQKLTSANFEKSAKERDTPSRKSERSVKSSKSTRSMKSAKRPFEDCYEVILNYMEEFLKLACRVLLIVREVGAFEGEAVKVKLIWCIVAAVQNVLVSYYSDFMFDIFINYYFVWKFTHVTVSTLHHSELQSAIKITSYHPNYTTLSKLHQTIFHTKLTTLLRSHLPSTTFYPPSSIL